MDSSSIHYANIFLRESIPSGNAAAVKSPARQSNNFGIEKRDGSLLFCVLFFVLDSENITEMRLPCGVKLSARACVAKHQLLHMRRQSEVEVQDKGSCKERQICPAFVAYETKSAADVKVPCTCSIREVTSCCTDSSFACTISVVLKRFICLDNQN